LNQHLCLPFDLEIRKTVKESLLDKLQEFSKPNALECDKLKTIKENLTKDIESYFTYLLHKGVPATNNKAEQLLRHAVIKRKLSFGFKTQKGADVASVLFSVLLSLWRRSKENFFVEYLRLLEESRALRTLPQ